MAASNPNVGARGQITLLNAGININSLDKSTGNAWEQNTFFHNGRHKVRPGLGLLGVFSTSLNANKGNATNYGYTSHVGSYYLQTDAGHEQLISLLTVRGRVADFLRDSAGTEVVGNNPVVNTVVLSVYDITTDTRTELLLTNKTAEQCTQGSESINKAYPHGFSNSVRDYQRPLVAMPTSCSFQQLQDVVYITIPGVGVYAYRPISPAAGYKSQRDVKVHNVNGANWQCEGESTAVSKVLPADGPFIESYGYIRPSEFGAPTTTAVLYNRAVYAVGRRLLFSDPDTPTHIIVDNVAMVPSEGEITALQSNSDSLVVFTANQVFIYQPGEPQALLSGGRFIEIARGTGAQSQNHTVNAGGTIIFFDTAGPHYVAGTEVKPLNEGIATWFTDSTAMQNPLSSYKVNSGATTLTNTQPRARIDLISQFSSCNLSWHDYTGTLYANFSDVTLVWRKGSGWSVWLFETDATVPNTVEATRRITKPWLVAGGQEVYAVTGPDTAVFTDGADYRYDNTYSVYQLGRGGGLDNTSCEQEDYRAPTSGWERKNGLAGLSSVYFGRMFPMPKAFRTRNQATLPIDVAFLLPVIVESATSVRDISIRATYNNTDWQILTTGPAGEVDFLLPPERLSTEANYQRGAMDATHQVRLFTGANPDNAGNELRIDFTSVGGTWTLAPQLNIAPKQPVTILYLPLIKTTASTQFDLDIDVTAASITSDAGLVINARAYVWKEAIYYPAQAINDDAAAQAVDWALKSASIHADGDQVKMRGIFTKILSYGTATTRIPANWIYGPLNTSTSSDYRDYAGQRVDWTAIAGNNEITQIDSIRKRMLSTGLNPAISFKTAGNVAKWGTTADATKGNLLIDDPAVNTLATSESVKGESFSTMLFGTIGHAGEHIEVQEAKGEYVVVGGKHRAGR